MMPGVDMNRVHLWMGLTHPVFGPYCLAVYSAAMGYSWYVAWIEAMMDATHPPRPSQK